MDIRIYPDPAVDRVYHHAANPEQEIGNLTDRLEFLKNNIILGR